MKGGDPVRYSQNRIRRLIVPCLAVTLQCADATADEAGNKLARQMLEAYEKVERYHATWEITQEDKPEFRMELITAFDRETRRSLIRFVSYTKEDDAWVRDDVVLQVNDAKKVHLGGCMNGGELQSMSREMPDPTYLDLMNDLMFGPVDLPLLFAEQPMYWLVSDEVVDISAVEPGGSTKDNEPGVRITGRNGFTVTVWLDPKTFFIRRASYGPMEYAPVSLAIDEELDDSLFDFEHQMSLLTGSPDSPASELRGNESVGTPDE